MKSKNWSAVALAGALLSAGLAQAVQNVNFANLTRNAAAATNPMFVVSGDIVKFDASLTANGTTNPPGTTGLGLCLEYKQSAVNDPTVNNLLATDNVADGTPTALSGCTAGGAVVTTGADFMVIKGWAHLVAGGWPNVALPVKLYDAQFTLPATPAGSTLIGFGASSVATGETFTSNGPLVLCARPTVTVAKTADGSETGPTAATFSVTLSAAVPAACGTGGFFPVSLSLGGTATVPGQPNADYAISGADVVGAGASVTVNFPADGAATTRTVSATPVDDSLIEGVETVTLTVAAGSANYGGVGNTASANIADNDPTVTIASSAATIPDNGTSATITVTLSGPAPGGGFSAPLTLPAANARYSTTCTSSLLVAAGASSAQCSVTATANTVANDGNVALAFSVNCTSTCTNGSPATANVTVIDDDIPVITAAASPATLTDSAGQVSTVTFSTTLQSAAPLTINFTPPAANARYALSSCTSPVTLPASTSSVAACTVTAVANTTLGDGNVTATTTVLAGSGYSVGSPSAAAVAVNNDDFATISVAVSPASVAENSGTPLVFTFTASVASPSATPIAFTPPPASGRYSSTCASPITLPISATTVTCSVTPINNIALDGSVNATLTLLASPGAYVVGSPATATGTITDDEIGVGVVAVTASVIEGGTAVFRLSCSGSGSVIANYSYSGTYSPLPASGNSLVTCGTPTLVSIPTIDDGIVNGTRTIILTITSLAPTGVMMNAMASNSGLKSAVATKDLVIDPANASATVVVLDNDQPIIIPTLSTLGLALLGLLLAAMAGFSVRRRRF